MEKTATQLLEDEHHLILKVIDSMAALADVMFEGQTVRQDTLTNLMDFMQVFVEKCHQEKEEKHLFPLLVKKGVPVAGCPIAVLTHEHTASRKMVADLSTRVEAYLKNPPEMRQFLVTTLRGIVELYPNHIWKENYLLFPMTDKILNQNEQQELLEKFEMVEESVGLDRHQRFAQLAEGLAGQIQSA